jgi:Predicted nucleotide-binding protein containing TIR -like domain
MAQNIFIAFGHEPAAHLELARFLQQLGHRPVLLAESDDLGLTIIEKFEHYAKQCQFAFAIFSPDDKQASELSGNDRWRARQNVVLELGWFMAQLGRRRVVILHKGQVDIPSDLLGVLHLPFQKSVFEVSEKIRQRLSNV